MLKTILAWTVVGAAVLAFLGMVVGSAIYYAREIGALTDGSDAPPEALPAPSAVALAVAPLAPVAARVLLPARNTGFPHDDHTTDRHARIRAFQQREAAIRAARRFM